MSHWKRTFCVHESYQKFMMNRGGEALGEEKKLIVIVNKTENHFPKTFLSCHRRRRDA